VMTEINAALVKKLRDATGAGMMECKAALTEAKGDIEEATTILRKRGLAQATKKAGRSTNEGLIGNYIHMGGKIGVLVEMNCESDFVARTDDFQGLAREIAMHIAAANPQYVRREDVPADVLERERAIYRGQMEGQNKPPAVIEKIVEGKLNSFYEQVCLLDQPSIRDPKMTIAQIVQAAIAKMGENIAIPRFVRFKLTEDLGGLRVGDELRVGGFKVGSVKSIEPAGSKVPSPASFDVCAIQESPANNGCARVTISPIPSGGADVIVFNDVNTFIGPGDGDG